ncbi:MAG TPA: hypothetical protein PKA88_38905, partial [Polyangiaceae bacterium]|nr:hypothetical protein [Polyangiaceae bacterium]
AICRAQPYVFTLGVVILAVGMSFAGSYGVARRHWDVEFTGATHAASFDPSVHIFLGMVGIGGIIAFVGLLMFVIPTVIAVFFGKKIEGKMPAW